MIARSTNQSGFTAVELLITLFVAAAFLVAAYQLFNVVIKDGGQARSESRAGNVAYDYMRRYTTSATSPCTPSTPLTNAAISIDSLSSTTITVAISCPSYSVNTVSKVDVAISYNTPQQTVKYSTYTIGPSTPVADITDGLVGWWKLNGDANTATGSVNGTASNTGSVTGQNGTANNAMSFNGTSSTIALPSTFSLGTTNVTLSCWVYNPSASNHGMFVHIGYTNGYGVGIGNTTTDTNGSKLVMLYEAVRWIPTSTTIGTGWHHIVMTIDGSSVPTGYVDGVSTGPYSGGSATTPNTNVSAIGSIPNLTTNSFTGSIDDVRIYNRLLSGSEISSLYAGGAR